MGRVVSLSASAKVAGARRGGVVLGPRPPCPLQPPPGGAKRLRRPYLRTRAIAGRLLPAFLIALFADPALAQSELAENQPSLSFTRANFHVVVDTVLLNVAVHSSDEAAASELRPSDFEVYEDGIARRITYFSPTNSPLSVVLLVDCSKSMSVGALEEAKRAGLKFVRESHPDTQFAIVTFSDTVARTLNFTNDRTSIEGALSKLTASGGTRLYDGIREAVEHWDGAQNRARVVVLLTDGRDEISETGLAEIENLLKMSEVTLFPCGVYSPAYRRLFMNDLKYYITPEVEKNLNPVWVLRHLADLCGTQALFTEPGRPLEQALGEIISELQHRYVLGFEPDMSLVKARYRSIEVKLKNDTTARIQARRGYVR
ncbi:MAG: VWA domain-containing protein [Acidobacteria bacterium]|nr:MAG: VWA domain-containing protein [Acidobacteriota bacterium]